jgi:hypothetical protein
MAYCLENRNLIPRRSKELSLIYSIQKGSGAKSESYSKGAETISLGVERRKFTYTGQHGE